MLDSTAGRTGPASVPRGRALSPLLADDDAWPAAAETAGRSVTVIVPRAGRKAPGDKTLASRGASAAAPTPLTTLRAESVGADSAGPCSGVAGAAAASDEFAGASPPHDSSVRAAAANAAAAPSSLASSSLMAIGRGGEILRRTRGDDGLEREMETGGDRAGAPAEERAGRESAATVSSGASARNRARGTSHVAAPDC